MTNTKKIFIGSIILLAGIILTFAYSNLNKPNNFELIFLLFGLILGSAGLSIVTSKDQYLLNTARIFLGITFIFSGWVKAVDPLGSTYKFIDYFDAWNMSFMNPTSFYLGILLSTAEFITGVALLLNLLSKYASLVALIFMIFFTPITFYLAMQESLSGKELVHDCGCFGDALVINNWQTFAKNIILFIPTIFIFIKRKNLKSIFDCKKQILGTSLATIFILIISIYGYQHLPIQDFRPYKIGANIPDGMIIPEGAPQFKYMTYFEYKNLQTGEIQKFDQNNLPYQEPETWEYVEDQEPERKLIQRGYEPPITNFTITSKEDGDITNEVLENEGYTIFMVAYDLTKSDLDNIENIKILKKFAENEGIKFISLTSTTGENVLKFNEQAGENFVFHNTDPITLKTIVRSNPGIVLMKHGTILGKWHHNDCPTENEIKNYIK